MPASAANRRRARPYTELQIFNRFAFLIVLRYPAEPAVPDRRALRERLHGVRDRFAAESGVEASTALAAHLSEVLAELMPERLGLYWQLRSEFNAASACLGDKSLDDLSLALPFAAKSPTQMHYRDWNRVTPTGRDECGIPSPDGAPVVPDVVLVPCLGYTSSGFRLGYGGGFYDRWLADHPHVTAIGVAWSACEIDEVDLVPQAHDQPLMLIVTERGVVG
ncbi:MAG: 5-formyltetrahydrofolate cyclo-ligase [Burkholderiales bacterium]|jgi:5-formyltetrahydrofolate cyclo-ligase|nr:5-formyltetrahydrofolate cyclo-ligase [Burkholderiales bacterium]